jgi:hypothetical protein
MPLAVCHSVSLPCPLAGGFAVWLSVCFASDAESFSAAVRIPGEPVATGGWFW